MRLINKLVALTTLLLLSIHVSAQDSKNGNVVVHADPRLQLLLKPHTAPTPPPPPVATKEKKHKPEPVKPHKIEVIEEDKPTAVHPPATTAAVPKTKPSSKPAPSGPARVTIGMQGEKVVTPAPDAAPPVTAAKWPPVHATNPPVTTSHGFRVQIYNGPDRKKAAEVKNDFMHRYPGVHCYLVYIAPGFRVKVGDYSSRDAADAMLRQLKPLFSPATMIVPDNIATSAN